MATSGQMVTLVRDAAADLSAKQYHAVKIDSAGKIALCTAAGEFAAGILQNDPTAGQAAEVAAFGVCKAKAGGNITAGNKVKVAADAEVIAATNTLTVDTSNTGSAADAVLGAYMLGTALSSAADGEIFEVLIHHPGGVPTTVS